RPAGQVIQPRHHLEVRPPREQLVDGRLLAGEPDPRPHVTGLADDVVARNPRAALGRREQRGQDPHRCRLARTVRTEQPEHRAGRHPQIDIAEHPPVAEPLSDPLGDHRRLIHPGTPIVSYVVRISYVVRYWYTVRMSSR